MDYTIENLGQQFPELAEVKDLVPLLDAATNLWLEQLPQRVKQTNSPITDFEDLGRGHYRFVVDGKLAKLRVNLEDKSAHDPDTTLYMATRLCFEGDGARRLMDDLGEFVRNCELYNLEKVASQKLMRYMEIAD